jgi:ADP-ribose pyrophosphatase YjhB (NUDIX family)
MSDAPLHSVSVAGVTIDDAGRVLLIRRRDNGQWQAPGGILELEETFEGGVIREVFEETGVRVEVERLTGVYKNVARGVVALVFRCQLVDGEATPSDEASEVAWIPVGEALERMSAAFAVRVDDAARSSPRVACRAHDGRDTVF